MASRHSYRLRSRADRAGRLPHAGRRRRAARPGLPLEARLDPLVRPRQRASLRPAPGQGEPGETPARQAGAPRLAQRVLRRDRRAEAPGGRRLRRPGSGGASPLEPAQRGRAIRGPAPEQPQRNRPAERVARRHRRPQGIVTPDSDGDASVPNYGSSFEESDYAPIPPRDPPFGLPAGVRRRRLGSPGHAPPQQLRRAAEQRSRAHARLASTRRPAVGVEPRPRRLR